MVAAAAAGLMADEATRVIIVPLALFAAIGLAEDMRGVSIPARLVLQSLAGSIAGALLVPAGHSAMSAAVTVVMATAWLVGYANAFNFMDGINGISAAQAMLAGVVYAVLGVVYNVAPLTIAGVVAAAAAVTFLPWNAGRARIFLGDVGSYGLGGMLGALAVFGVLNDVPVEAMLAPLALYLADTGWTLIRRKAQGEAWYRPHRTHAYQRLTGLGWSHQLVTLFTVVICGAISAMVVAASRSAPPTRVTVGFAALGVLAAYLAWPSWVAAHKGREQPKVSSDGASGRRKQPVR